MANPCGCDREAGVICDFHLDHAISNRQVQMMDWRDE